MLGLELDFQVLNSWFTDPLLPGRILALALALVVGNHRGYCTVLMDVSADLLCEASGSRCARLRGVVPRVVRLA